MCKSPLNRPWPLWKKSGIFLNKKSGNIFIFNSSEFFKYGYFHNTYFVFDYTYIIISCKYTNIIIKCTFCTNNSLTDWRCNGIVWIKVSNDPAWLTNILVLLVVHLQDTLDQYEGEPTQQSSPYRWRSLRIQGTT